MGRKGQSGVGSWVVRCAFAAMAALVVAGCGDPLKCSTAADCTAPGAPVCDPVAKTCAACVADGDCPSGEICQATPRACVPGCNVDHGCGDAGVCESGSGACVECVADTDCRDPARSACNTATHRCAACTTTDDKCGHGLYCAPSGGDFACVAGCKADADCPPAGAANATLVHCDTKLHACAVCVADADCPSGKVCHNDTCVDGCSDGHACAGSLACCNLVCVDNKSDPTHCGGCGMACGVGQNCCASSCSNPTTDPMNCGACGKVCSLAHATADCRGAACVVAACADGYADCNQLPGDGCETELKANVNACSACGIACSPPHATPQCALGVCQIAACAAGYADCNKDVRDGCEANTNSDVNNCGACALACSHANAIPACVAGKCQLTCQSGFADCDGDLTNGCETDLTRDLKNCGACGVTCAAPNGTPACGGGVCRVTSCNAGYADCNSMAKDGCEVQISGDASNCGACGHVCSSANGAPSCAQGACQIACQAGFSNCDGDVANGCEVDTNNSLTNCGACKAVCMPAHASPACGGGACTVFACVAGWADCDKAAGNGCEVSTTTDIANCGACGNACSGNNGAASCVASQCRINCAMGFGNCDGNVANGCESTLASDAKNCGACGYACAPAHATANCTNSVCGIASCDLGWADCNHNPADGCEINLNGDSANCGACGTVCPSANANAQCNGGVCKFTCNNQFADCNGVAGDGCEVNLGFDANHCGSCNIACSNNNIPTPTCGNGQCNGVCAPGTSDCNGNRQFDGCEVVLANTVTSCGNCGNVCSQNHIAPACANGSCEAGVCAAGWDDCDHSKGQDGCETHVAADPNNCGACNDQCSNQHINRLCAAGSCESGACLGHFADCNMDKRTDGCEVDTSTDARNCGGCSLVCSQNNVNFTTCTAGVCDGACQNGWADCNGNKLTDGCELNIFGNDLNNCGGCAMACSQNNVQNPTCNGGFCSGFCNFPFQDCNNDINRAGGNGCETNVMGNDAANCGGCGRTCSANHVAPACQGGQCNGACDMGYSDCNFNKEFDGCESFTANDPNNCGGCGHICSAPNAINSCNNGICGIAGCQPNFGDCNGNPGDGCETNLTADRNNCAQCGKVCPNNAPNCVNGACSANSPPDMAGGGGGAPDGGGGGGFYAPFGPQTNVPLANLSGWTVCYSDSYANGGGVPNACNGKNMMLACHQKGSPTLDVLAWAPASDVLFPVPQGSPNGHIANGTQWYFDGNSSWGFAGAGDVLMRTPCDIGPGDNASRLCWQTNNNSLSPGARCGVNMNLNGNGGWERLVFQAN